MTENQKLTKLKTQLNIGASDTSFDSKLLDYLDSSKNEILSWMYTNYSEIPEEVTDVPIKYEIVQIQAVVIALNLEGGENETEHVENGISRYFKYSSMVDYIHDHVFQLV